MSRKSWHTSLPQAGLEPAHKRFLRPPPLPLGHCGALGGETPPLLPTGARRDSNPHSPGANRQSSQVRRRPRNRSLKEHAAGRIRTFILGLRRAGLIPLSYRNSALSTFDSALPQCPGQDSNLHARCGQGLLRPLRLPIPPPGHFNLSNLSTQHFPLSTSYAPGRSRTCLEPLKRRRPCRSATGAFMHRAGIEPASLRLKAGCLAIRPSVRTECTGKGSNLHPAL